MSKQRECPWRRTIVKTKTDESFEERRRREVLRKTRHLEARQKKQELLDKRKALRQMVLDKEAAKEKLLEENRKLRMAQRQKKKQKKPYEE